MNLRRAPKTSKLPIRLDSVDPYRYLNFCQHPINCRISELILASYQQKTYSQYWEDLRFSTDSGAFSSKQGLIWGSSF